MCAYWTYRQPRNSWAERDWEREPADVRVSDADRRRTIDELRRHTADGRLDLDEFDERVGEVYAAKTRAELERTLRELPRLSPPLAPGRPRVAGASGPLRRCVLLTAAVILVVGVISVGRFLFFPFFFFPFFFPLWPLFFMGVWAFRHTGHAGRDHHAWRGPSAWDRPPRH